MQHTSQFLRKRKFLLFLPIVVIPFMTLLLWSMGFGRSTQPEVDKHAGFNTKLPSPAIDQNAPTDKLSLYQKADADSIKRMSMHEYDSLYFPHPPKDMHDNDKYLMEKTPASPPASVHSTGLSRDNKKATIYEDPNEAAVRQRLEALNRELSKATTPKPLTEMGNESNDPGTDFERLEKMLQQTAAGPDTDPQMQQIKEVLDRIVEVQHPDIVKQRLQNESQKNKEKVYPVSTKLENAVCEVISPGMYSNKMARLKDTVPLQTPVSQQPWHGQLNNFYEIDPAATSSVPNNGITAVVHETRTILTGATIKLRLTQDIYLQGVLIPNGTFVFGDCKLDGERLNISINAIRYGNSRFPVSLTVYDYDGLSGIPIRDAISRQTTSQGADQALQSLQMYSLDPSLGAQAATAGIETVKNLLSKKIKLVKTTVKADYPILLIDNNTGR
jgi:conjugative transposon TraM protein